MQPLGTRTITILLHGGPYLDVKGYRWWIVSRSFPTGEELWSVLSTGVHSPPMAVPGTPEDKCSPGASERVTARCQRPERATAACR